MPADPRGSPSDEDYIKHLEFFNEQYRQRIEELERQRGELFMKTEKKGKLFALIGLWLGFYLWIPLKIIRWFERERQYES